MSARLEPDRPPVAGCPSLWLGAPFAGADRLPDLAPRGIEEAPMLFPASAAARPVRDRGGAAARRGEEAAAPLLTG